LATPFPVSVLDLAPVVTGETPAMALRNSLDLVRHAEEWGYTRYWVAEHHNMPAVASTTPPVLIAHLADATSRIRVGSGGVMLPNHPPLVVAEQFGMLEALHPGRIDLGIGRAPGTDPNTAKALRREAGTLTVDEFPDQLMDLMSFFTGDFPEDHPYRQIRAVTALDNMPDFWLLGSSGYSAQVAGILGIPFAFAHHFSSQNTLPAMELYRERFQASPRLSEPYAMVCANVICADTDERSEWLSQPSRLHFARIRQGLSLPFPSPEEVAETTTDADRRFMAEHTGSYIVGDPERVRRELEDLMRAAGAQELMITTTTHAHADRLHSFELLARTFGLTD
jgi:luciferase family oxidoreductase group 1